MTARPVDVGTFGEEAYARVDPLTYADEQNGWALLVLMAAMGRMFNFFNYLVREDDANDLPGWGKILDVDNCPEDGLPYLAQFLGLRIPFGIDDAAARQFIKDKANWDRGSPDAIRKAAQTTLTGTKTVYVIERDAGSAWHLKVTTLDSETASDTVTLKAIKLQKPIGIILTYDSVPGGDYATLAGTHTDYNDIDAQFATYDIMRTDPSVT